MRENVFSQLQKERSREKIRSHEREHVLRRENMFSGERICSYEREHVRARDDSREKRDDGEHVACKYEVCKILNDSMQQLSDSTGNNHEGELVLSVTQ